jgi:cobyrinic acid a,c-diamide synthase
MNAPRRCPALLISAPASGQGKTTVTAALARYHRQRGRHVRVFKTGPDFLDPMILERASGNPVYQLDLWMGGEAHCRQLLYEAAGSADLILIEGVMGLFDGDSSAAKLATLLGVPVLAVINAAAMSETFGAIAHGLATYRRSLPFAGVLANNVASESHYSMLVESLPTAVASYGWLTRSAEFELPHRHLGLTQAIEIADLDARLDRIAAMLQLATDEALPTPVEFFAASTVAITKHWDGLRIGVARDVAFSFLYRANLDTLRALGAELVFFSPLVDTALPQVDSLYLPGGYPELHLASLEHNDAMAQAIRAHHAAGKPIVAECGGMLYLFESLTDTHGHHARLVGLLPGHARMQTQLANLGMHSVSLPEGNLRGHTFHYSRIDTALEAVVRSEPVREKRRAEPVFRLGRLHATYLHLYFPSNPEAVARLFTPSPQ